jgi:hypothetical protein
MSLLILLAGCTPPDPVVSAADSDLEPPVTIASLRGGGLGRGYVDVVDARLAGGPTADGASVYLQDRVTGEGAELRIGVLGLGPPPPVGTPIHVRAWFEGAANAPVLWLVDTADLVVDGEPEELDVAVDPVAPRPLALARFTAVTVTSEPDPTGVADTSLGRRLDARFGVVLPSLGNTGDVTGIVLADGSIAPRSDEDWAGPREPGPVIQAILDDVLEGRIAAGAVVDVPVLQATPWTRDGRGALVQDETGRGVWLDTEAFGHGASKAGDLLVLRAEVREADGYRWLRSWWRAPPQGSRAPVVLGVLGHGVLVDVDVAGAGRPGWTGERVTAEGWTLDDRFVDLDTVPDPARVRVAVDASSGAVELAVVAVIEPEP